MVQRINWLLCLGFAFVVDAQSATERVSVDSTGGQVDDPSEHSFISADGRYVTFVSRSSDLVPGDTNDADDVFVHDRGTGVTERVSVDSAGVEANSFSAEPVLSADGRYVAFRSDADNLVPGDTNNHSDIFVHDRLTGLTTRVSVDSIGAQTGASSFVPSISATGRFVAYRINGGMRQIWVNDRNAGVSELVSVSTTGQNGNGNSEAPSISSDGRYVAFQSRANNLVPLDTNGDADIFVHDRQTGMTERVNVSSAGEQANDSGGLDSFAPSISSSGRYVVFGSDADNLTPSDTNGDADIFVHDREAGVTERVSVDSAGTQANMNSNNPAFDADGRFVVFDSDATNLVSDDTNRRTDIFVHDRQTGTTTRASVDSANLQADSHSYEPSLSLNGRFATYYGYAENLVPSDTNGVLDVFITDRWAHSPLIPDLDVGDRLGYAVSLDGDTILVGARLGDHSGYVNNGAAYVYDRTAATDEWTLAKLFIGPLDVASDQDKFGHSVSVSGDTIAIGAENDDDAGFRAGKVYVYGRDVGGTDNWGLVKALTGSDTETRDFFGRSLALDGDRLVVGAHVEDENGSNAGAVYVFERNEGGADNWGQTQKLLASDGAAGDRFGASVDLDDDNLVVGAFRKATAAGASAGQAYVFRATGGVWSEIRTLMPAGAVANDQFGYSVSIDGVRVAVGSRFSDSATGNQTGSVHVFAQDVGGVDNWGEVQKLEASDLTAGDRFGTAVALSSDRLAVGSPLQDDNGDKAGKAYVYKYNGTDFTEIDQLINEHVTLRDEFGIAIAIDGSSCVVGAWLDNRPSNNTGAAYVFEVL